LAHYTEADLGLTDSIDMPFYDEPSHSVLLRMGNVDYRRVYLDRRDPVDADLADICHALSVRGPEWDVAGPGLRSSWNGTAHTDATDQVDVLALDGTPVHGFKIANASTGKSIVEQLTEFFPNLTGHYWVETDFKATAKLLGAASLFALTDDDLIVQGEAGGTRDPIEEQVLAEREFPRRYMVEYLDSALDGEPNTAIEKRYNNPVNSVFSSQDKRSSFPILATSAESKTVTKRGMARAWSEERSIGWQHGRRHLALDAGDPGTLTTRGVTYNVRISSAELGNNYVTKVQALTNDSDAYILSIGLGIALGGFIPPGLTRAAITDFEILDVPPVTEGQPLPGLYVVPLVPNTTWKGATWQRSDDLLDWEQWYATDQIAIWGRASLLADAPAGLDLVNTVDVLLPAGLNTAPSGSAWGSVVHALTNAGFETGDLTGWTEVLTAGYSNWQALASAAGATETINPAEGSWFVGADVDSVADAELFQDLDAASAGVPTADFDASLVEVVVSWRQNSNAAANDAGGVRLEYWDGDPTGAGSLLDSDTSPMRSSPDNVWQVFEFVNTAPTGTRWYRLVLVGDGNASGTVALYYDQIVVESREIGSVFQAATDQEMIDGANRIIIGDEVLAFGDWEYLGSDIYRLSRLLRGLVCTDWATGRHFDNELFVLADDRLGRGSMALDDIGKVHHFASVSAETGARSPALSVSYGGRDVAPCAPFALYGHRAPWHGDVLLRWDADTLGGSPFEIELLDAITGQVVATYAVARQPIEIDASTVDFEHMTVATVTHVSGAVGNGDFETGDTTGWTPSHKPASLDVDTLAPRQSVGNHAPYEGTYLLRLDGTTSDTIAGIERVLDLVGDGVAAFDLDNGFAMLEVRWRQAGFNATRDPLRCEIEWIGSGNGALEGVFALDNTFIKSGFHAGAVSTSNFGTSTPGKRLLLETAALAEARGTWMTLGTAPSGGVCSVNIEKNGVGISALWTVADGALFATLANASADEYDENDTAGLDGATVTAPAADLQYQIAFRDLEVYILESTSSFTLPEDLPGATATATSAPSGGAVTFDVRINGTDRGNITFADGVTTATFVFAADQAVVPGDRVTITAPANLQSIAGVSFSLPITTVGGVLKAEQSETLPVPADVWTLRTFNSRSVIGARFARVRLVGIAINSNDPSPSVDTFLDDIQIETVDAGIWRTLRSTGQPADFAPLIPGELLYQTDPDGPNAGYYELVSVTIPGSGDAIEFFSFVPAGSGTVDDTTGSEKDDWTQYGEQVRIPLAAIQQAGYQRGDAISVKVYELNNGNRGYPIAGTV
ncbi:MAG TPA: phage tail protein, partial [Phycisphaerae bacterium]|nr:phage tail protein [Phycisphaerae bacterium]